MDHVTAIQFLVEEQNKADDKANFIVRVPDPPHNVRSLLTTLRHLMAEGKLSGYHIIDEAQGAVQVLDFVA